MERYTVVYGDDAGRVRTYPLREGVKREDIPRAIETASGRRLELKSVVAVEMTGYTADDLKRMAVAS